VEIVSLSFLEKGPGTAKFRVLILAESGDPRLRFAVSVAVKLPFCRTFPEMSFLFVAALVDFGGKV